MIDWSRESSSVELNPERVRELCSGAGEDLPALIAALGYEDVEPVGSGGMGAVYRGRNPRLGRVEAIKVTHDDTARERFRREARVLGGFKSQDDVNIVLPYDLRQTPGRDFLSMEYVEGGRPLSALLAERGRIDPATAVRWAIQIGRALDHAHRRGVVHRDVKPANVLIDATGNAWLIDFGLASWPGSDDPRGPDADGLTCAGTFLGTPGFAAPEQVESSPAVTPAADVYGLGATLHAMLTGRPPHDAATAADYRLLLRRRPTVVPADEAVGEVDPALSSVVTACLHYNPQARPATAADLCASLEALTAEDPTAAIWRNAAMLPLAVAGTVAQLAAVVVAFVFFAYAGCVLISLTLDGKISFWPATVGQGIWGLLMFGACGRAVAEWWEAAKRAFAVRPSNHFGRYDGQKRGA